MSATRQTASQKFTRSQPSQAEQDRRRAWGKKWGYLVSESVKQALRSA